MDTFIFLDIDGVLNSEQYYLEKPQHKRWKEFKGKLDKHIAWGVCNIDPKAVKLLNKLVAETKAKIVVSSSWRGDYALQTIFALVGITEPIYGETPRLESRFRGEEIAKWLGERQEPYKYVILDDDSDMLDTQCNHFIHTDWKVGLTEENVNKAIKILMDNKIPVRIDYIWEDNTVGYYLIPSKYLYEIDDYLYLTQEGKLWFMKEYDGPLGESYLMKRCSEEDIFKLESKIKYLTYILNKVKNYG